MSTDSAVTAAASELYRDLPPAPWRSYGERADTLAYLDELIEDANTPDAARICFRELRRVIDRGEHTGWHAIRRDRAT